MSSPSVVRAEAISRLKRAASLPRMKNGRRPSIPAHGGAVTEDERNERSPSQDEDTSGGSGEASAAVTTPAEAAEYSPEEARVETSYSEPVDPAPEATPVGKDSAIGRVDGHANSSPVDEEEDLRTPDDEDDEAEDNVAAELSPSYPPVASSVASLREQLARQKERRRMASPPPTAYTGATLPLVSPMPALHRDFIIGRSPLFPAYTATSPNHMAPSLDQISDRVVKGLMRSNSEAHRNTALNHLEGRDSTFVAPAAALGAALRRSNTTGGERSAARNKLFDKLDRRVREVDTDLTSAGDVTSAGEETSASKLGERRPRRPSIRHPRRASTSTSAHVVDDRDVPTNAPNTPAASLTTLPPSIPPPTPGLFIRPMPRPDSIGSSQATSARRHSAERNRESADARANGENHFEYDTAFGRSRQQTPMVIETAAVAEDVAENAAEQPQEDQTMDADEVALMEKWEANEDAVDEDGVRWQESMGQRLLESSLDEVEPNSGDGLLETFEPSDISPQPSPSTVQLGPTNLKTSLSALASMPIFSIPFPSTSNGAVLQKPLPSDPIMSDASSTSALPASTTYRSRSESATDWEQVTDRDYSTVEERSSRKGAPSPGRLERMKDFVKPMLGRKRTRSSVSISADQRKEKGGSSGSKDSSSKRSSRENGLPSSGSVASLPSQSGFLHNGDGSLPHSILSLPTPAVRNGVSPVPPATAADFLKYGGDSKLMPFPGIARLEQERGMIKQTSPTQQEFSFVRPDSSNRIGPTFNGDVTIPRQPSLTHLATKSSSDRLQNINGHAASGQAGYIDVTRTAPSTLPQDRHGVKAWLKVFGKAETGTEKMDRLLLNQKSIDSGTEREEGSMSKAFVFRGSTKKAAAKMRDDRPGTAGSIAPPKTADSGRPLPLAWPRSSSPDQSKARGDSLSSTSPSGPLSQYSLVTDPSGSALSTPGSVAQEETINFLAKSESPAPADKSETGAALVNGDRKLGSDYHTDFLDKVAPMVAPRKLLLSSSVLQVVQGNIVKERFLFLFSDILVIAKPTLDSHATRPDNAESYLDCSFNIKSVVELRRLRINARPNDVSYANNDRVKSILRTFVQGFAEDPHHAVESLAETFGLQNDPIAIANVLFDTAELDKNQLGEFLSERSTKAILRAYIDCFGFEGVRVDVALRTFLLSIRLPSSVSGLEHLLGTFAGRWFDANAKMVAFDRDLTTRLVLAIMQLNEAMHDTFEQPSLTSNTFNFANRSMTKEEFVQAFRTRDARGMVEESYLTTIFRVMEKQRLAQALDISQSDAEVPAAMIPAKLPTRVTYKMPSERITVRIPRPDRHFAIRLYGHGLIFDPEFLDFSKSTEQSFCIIGDLLGERSAVFGREGANAALYTGLPLSRTFLVERAFMQNTFQVAFRNRVGVPRKYLFSMQDPFLLQGWTDMLTQEIRKRCSLDPTNTQSATVSSQRRTAAEAIAFRLLCDTLLPDENGSTSDVPQSAPGTPANNSRTPSAMDTADRKLLPADGVSITGRSLVTLCQQNSLLPLVLLRSQTPKSSMSQFGPASGRGRDEAASRRQPMRV